MSSKKIKILNSFLALLTILSFNINLMRGDKTLLISFDGNNIIYALLFLVIIYIYNQSLNIKITKNEKKVIFILSFIMAIIETFGILLNIIDSITIMFQSLKIFIAIITKFLGFFVFLYYLFKLVSLFLKKDFTNKENPSMFNSNIKIYFLLCIAIFVSWIPYLLAFFPGIMTNDSLAQFCKAMGDCALNNHHPNIHTGLVYIARLISNIFNGDNMLIVIIYSILQMILMSLMFAYSIFYINKRKTSDIFILFILLYYAFFPIHAIYSITMWKDVIFGGLMMLFTIEIIWLIEDNNIIKKRDIIRIIIISILTMLFRNNGIYVVLLTYLILIIFLKNQRKYISFIVITLILFNSIYKGPIFKLLNATEGSIVEALSVPLQQISRVELEKRNELKLTDKEFINNLFDEENIGDYYLPHLSDPVKSKANEKYILKNKLDFIKNWFQLGIRYPGIYVNSFLSNNYGYYYYSVNYWTVGYRIESNDYGLYDYSLLPNLKQKMINNNIFNLKQVPIVSFFYSIGGTFNLFLVLITTLILKKHYKLILAFTPVLMLWFTTLASPVHAEFRYVYGFFTCMPILISITLFVKENKKDKGSEVNG